MLVDGQGEYSRMLAAILERVLRRQWILIATLTGLVCGFAGYGMFGRGRD